MRLETKLTDNLFFLAMGTVYTYCVTKSIITSTVLNVPDSALFFLSLLFIFILNVYFFNKYTAIIITASGFFIVFFVFMNLALSDFKVSWYTDAKDFLQDIYWFIRGYYPYKPDYDMPLAVILSVAVALVAAVNIKVRFNFYVITGFGGALVLLPTVMNYYRTKQSMLIFSLCFLVFLLKRLNLSAAGRRRGSRVTNAGFSVVLIPLCAGLIFVMNFLPAPEIKDTVNFTEGGITNRAGDFLYTSFNPKYFSFQTTGFTGKDGRLGGKVTAKGNFVMDVYSDERVYLSGASKNLYTGWSWENTMAEKAAVKEYKDSDFELADALGGAYKRYGADTEYIGITIRTPRQLHYDDMMTIDWYLADEGDIGQVQIRIGGARTAAVFTPSYSRNISFNSQVELYSSKSGNLSTKELLRNNSEYTIYYLKDLQQRAYNLEQIYSRVFSEEQERTTEYTEVVYEAVEQTRADNLEQIYIRIFSEERTTEYTEAVNEAVEQTYRYISPEYFILPEDLPKRVYDLTADITKDALYPSEKIDAIINYLKNFPYTLEPDDVPEGDDFVDYFLFTGKEGYCTYFASALAVMGRCAGIPTRYMEGYVTPPEKSSYGAYTVTTYQAHAWVEAYMNGAWVTFEATPPFAYVPDESGAAPPVEMFSPTMRESGKTEYMEQMGFSPPKPAATARTGAGTVSPAPTVSGRALAEERFRETLRFYITMLLSAALSVCIVFLILTILVLARYYKFRRIDKSPNRIAVTAYFKHILKAAKVYEYPIMKNETVYAYARRIGRRFAFENETVYMSELARIFSSASYGSGEITDDETDVMRNCYFELTDMLKRYRLLKIQYFLYKYVLNKI